MKTKKATVPLASLRERRIALGLSQAKLAAELGVAPMTVSRWELARWG
jgi:transcriptional regulator with XRE-family HTH domain